MKYFWNLPVLFFCWFLEDWNNLELENRNVFPRVVCQMILLTTLNRIFHFSVIHISVYRYQEQLFIKVYIKQMAQYNVK